MYRLHTFLLTVCFVASSVSGGYEVINNEIIERIDLDNGQELQRVSPTGSVKQTPLMKHHVERVVSGDDFNSVQDSQETLSVSSHQPSIVYAAIQAMPHIITSNRGQNTENRTDRKEFNIQQATTEAQNIRKPNTKPEEPNEDKSKDAKVKLYSHLKQAMPKLYSILNGAMEDASGEASTGEGSTTMSGEMRTTLRTVDVRPYATIIDDDTDLKAEQSEDPYVVYDKMDYLKPTHVKKTVKTHKTGEEKKSVYPKDARSASAEKDDLETDSTIWIGYGLGVPYKYPYNSNYPSPLYGNYYAYGRPYSGWTRGYTGSPYYGGYVERTGVDAAYAGTYSYGTGSSYNNYGTGYGPYGGYL